jgi:hypothetical protein
MKPHGRGRDDGQLAIREGFATFAAFEITSEPAMPRKVAIIGATIFAVYAVLAVCASTPTVSGPVTVARCPLDSHTEAFPNNPDPKRAYGCRSNQSGFLNPPSDERERMRPQ